MVIKLSLKLLCLIILILSGCANMSEYIKVSKDSSISSFVGKKVCIEGKISNEPWQHLIDFNKEYPVIDYFNIEGGTQIVIYSKIKINSDKKIKIFGTVIRTKGGSKRPGSDEVYSEDQLIVDKWEAGSS